MNRQEKINKIMWWLHRYGDRDDDGFCITNEVVDLHLQYRFGEEGDEFYVNLACKKADNPKMNAEYIEDFDNEFLDKIIESLENDTSRKEFIQYLESARKEFTDYINSREWETELRTKCIDILIAYDQAVAKSV